MRHILIATDLSERSQRALHRAALLAMLADAPLSILHVVDDELPDEFVRSQIDQATTWLEAHLPQDGLPAPRLIVRAGNPHEQILKAADEVDADLIVLGGHRRRLLFDSFIGTTAERLLRISARPILIVHSVDLEPYRRVQVATDLSTASARAFHVARSLGLLPPGPSVVHVFVAVGQGKLRQAGIDPAARIASERSAATQRLATFINELEIRDIQFRTVLREGRAAAQLLHAVADEAPQLLVLGTRGLTGIKRAVLGSVTEAVLRSVSSDVLVVPGPPA